MNQRIRELAEQATSIVEMIGPQGYASSYANFDREKFAELIVRECVSQMEWQKISPKGEGAYNSALDLAQRNIKEHFGVEP